MPFEAKRFGRVAVALPEVFISAVSPRARASSARSRSSQMPRTARPSSPGVAAKRLMAASASVTSLASPRSSSVFTRTPVTGTFHISNVPSRNRWSAAERMSGIASSISPRRAFSRAEYALTKGNSPRLCPLRMKTSLTSASSWCPCARSASVSQCTSALPSVIRLTVVARSSPDRSAFCRASCDIAHRGIVGRHDPARNSQVVDPGDDGGVAHRFSRCDGPSRARPTCPRAIPDGLADNGQCPARRWRPLTETRC